MDGLPNWVGRFFYNMNQEAYKMKNGGILPISGEGAEGVSLCHNDSIKGLCFGKKSP